MSLYNRVVWYEGMFLQPQHFQQQDRFFENILQNKIRLMSGSAWGFEELVLDTSLISTGKIGILKAKGFFPDGTYFDIPAIDKAPDFCNIEEGMDNTYLYLTLPLRKSDIAEAGEKTYSKPCRNHIINFQINDATSDNYHLEEIQVGTLNCKILSEHEALSAFTVIPFAKIVEVKANHQIKFDEQFLPAWLNAHNSVTLENFSQEIHGLLQRRSEMLSARLMDDNYGGTSEVLDMMLLQLLNKYEQTFYYLLNKSPLHPELLYRESIQLQAELATFISDKRRPEQVPNYQHEDLTTTFQPLKKAIKQSLSIVLEQNALCIPLTGKDYGYWQGEINDKNIITTCEFILAVYSDIPNEHIKTSLPSQIKIAPAEYINTLISKALPGVAVTPISVAPRQIPYHANYSYFTLDVKDPLWCSLENTSGLSIHISKNYPGLKLELWAIKG